MTSTAYSHPVGKEVEKVGVTTGWTYGDITESCIDVKQSDGYAIRCANRVHMWVAGGDSGAPVFALNDPADPNNSAVMLMGTQSGATITGTYNGQQSGEYAVYTSYRALENELGVLDQGILNPRTSITLAPVTLNESFSPTGVTLNWNAAVATGSSTPTQYRIYTYNVSLQLTELGRLRQSRSPTTLVATTTNTSFFIASFASSTSCTLVGDGASADHYYVVAWNQGITSTSNQVCAQ